MPNVANPVGVAARAIHQGSSRANRALVAINCAPLSETLLESELFGHEKGAFTGAVTQKKGKLEIAGGGTLFLDEVGELAPQLQAKLLRVLQEREFERVGGTRTIKTDIRLIAATNRNLEEAMRDGSFRQDLYYRLNVVQLTMPALRERLEDVPLLTRYFIGKFSRQCKRQISGVSEDARRCMMNYDWPGNVRELENAIERAVVLGSSNIILPEDLPEALTETEAPDPKTAEHAKYHEAINELKRRLIIGAVAQAVRQLHRSGSRPRRSSQLPSPLDKKPEPESRAQKVNVRRALRAFFVTNATDQVDF